jgi:hypothetical protein
MGKELGIMTNRLQEGRRVDKAEARQLLVAKIDALRRCFYTDLLRLLEPGR